VKDEVDAGFQDIHQLFPRHDGNGITDVGRSDAWKASRRYPRDLFGRCELCMPNAALCPARGCQDHFMAHIRFPRTIPNNFERLRRVAGIRHRSVSIVIMTAGDDPM
jgi:hypothetical protein